MSPGDDSWKAAQDATFGLAETGLAPVPKRGESVEKLLAAVLERLDAEGVSYLVMRNHQGYPEKVTGDVDLVVCKSDLARGREIIVACARAAGWEVFLEARRPYLAYIGLSSARLPERFALVIELFAGGTWY